MRVSLDGREFNDVDRQITAAQNDYIQAQLALSGITDLLVELTHIPDDEVRLKKVRESFLVRVLISGRKSYLLAGCLTEVGTKWNRVEADRNAAIFDDLTGDAEVKQMVDALALVVFAFFQSAETFSKTSPKSSSPSAGVPATENEARARSETSRQ